MIKSLLESQLQEGEYSIVIIREYIITKAATLCILLGSYLGLFFLMFWLFSLGWIGVVLFLTGLITVLLYAIRIFIIWYFDVMILTDRRLLDIYQSGMFSKRVQEIVWSDIRDVQYQQKGLLATLGHYGSIHIYLHQTAEPIFLYNVHQPKQIRDIIASHASQANFNQESTIS